MAWTARTLGAERFLYAPKAHVMQHQQTHSSAGVECMHCGIPSLPAAVGKQYSPSSHSACL